MEGGSTGVNKFNIKFDDQVEELDENNNVIVNYNGYVNEFNSGYNIICKTHKMGGWVYGDNVNEMKGGAGKTNGINKIETDEMSDLSKMFEQEINNIKSAWKNNN